MKLTSQRFAEIDLLTVQTDSAAAGDHDSAVVKGVVRLGESFIRAAGGSINLGRALHPECLVRTFPIEFLDERIELSLLLEDIGAGRPRRFLLQSQMHAFMAAVLLRMARPDALNADAQP